MTGAITGILSQMFSSSDNYDIRKIEIGMDKEAVRHLFGKPKEITGSGGASETWTYTVPFRIFVQIKFDENGLVSSKYRSGEPCSDQ